jgi:hypothetical protein
VVGFVDFTVPTGIGQGWFHGCRVLALEQGFADAEEIFDTSKSRSVETSGLRVYVNAIAGNPEPIETFLVVLPPHLVICSHDLSSLRETLSRLEDGDDTQGLPVDLARLAASVPDASALWGLRTLSASDLHPLFYRKTGYMPGGIVISWTPPSLVHFRLTEVSNDLVSNLMKIPVWTGLKVVTRAENTVQMDFSPTPSSFDNVGMVVLMLGVFIFV